jgi:phenylalanyl-tRNA synthetase beta chain
MKVVYNWLKEFVDATAPATDLRSRLSLAGIAIDALDDTPAGPVLDAEITANRPDCLGHYGIAREVAAIYRLQAKPLRPKFKESAEKVSAAARVEVETPELCGRYTARVMRGVKVGPSPDWLRQRLEAIDQKSINNVVDVTNYVMFELGQPLHAFDLDQLAAKRIIVRRARQGEKIKTLDNAERTLAKEMCVIADASRAVAIAGVMGGAESEIGLASRDILLESAWFDPISVRRTSKALGLRSEASYRFERGTDPEMAELASRRSAELIQQIAGGEILEGVVDVYPGRAPQKKIEISRRELLRVMGADVPDRDIEEILTGLGFQPALASPGAWQCMQPSWRADVARGVDLIEEVARHYGYEKFPPRLPPAKQPARRLPHADALDRLRERVIALGYNEIVEIPIVDAQRDELFRAQGLGPAAIGNPLAENASMMRSSGIVSMINAIEWNLNHSQRNLRLFEIGKTYEWRNREPVEVAILTLGATGLARQKTIYENPRQLSLADLKGDVERIGELAGGFGWQDGQAGWLAAGKAGFVHLAKFGALDAEGDLETFGAGVGLAGQLAKRVADQLKLRQDVFVAELRLEPLLIGIETARADKKFASLPRFPAVERDFSLVLPDGVSFARVAGAVAALEIPEIESVEPADLFRGGQVPAGKFSLMIRVRFQSMETTLTEEQISGFSARIVSILQQNLGAVLRAS